MALLPQQKGQLGVGVDGGSDTPLDITTPQPILALLRIRVVQVLFTASCCSTSMRLTCPYSLCCARLPVAPFIPLLALTLDASWHGDLALVDSLAFSGFRYCSVLSAHHNTTPQLTVLLVHQENRFDDYKPLPFANRPQVLPNLTNVTHVDAGHEYSVAVSAGNTVSVSAVCAHLPALLLTYCLAALPCSCGRGARTNMASLGWGHATSHQCLPLLHCHQRHLLMPLLLPQAVVTAILYVPCGCIVLGVHHVTLASTACDPDCAALEWCSLWVWQHRVWPSGCSSDCF